MSVQRRQPGPPSYYDILNLSSSAIEEAHAQGGDSSNQLIKRAYRRALLSHHPDKQKHPQASIKPNPQITKSSSSDNDSKSKYTIDQISQAYAILSSPSQRATYDKQLKLLHLNQTTTNGTSQDGTPTIYEISKTGIENVDLDDLEFEQQEDEASETKWYRPCRCGNPRGYLFAESDLEEASDLGELMVGCADCSLWLRVHFAVLEEEDEEEEEENPGKDQQVIGKDRLGQDGRGEDGKV